MPTIKIKSTDPVSQGPFVLINAEDFNPALHEAFDPSELVALLPAGIAASAPVAAGPSVEELAAAAAELEQRRAELDERERLLNDQADANAAEAQRVADEAATLEAAKAAAAAPVDPSSMTKAQLQAALDAKGIEYPAAADKAALLSLLTTPVA